MPNTIALAAFVIGLVLVIAALLGTNVKIVQVELPRLAGPKRVITGVLGIALVAFGLADGKLPSLTPPTHGASTGASAPAQSASGPTMIDTPRLNVNEGMPLPDAMRMRSSSVQVEYGCVWLFESPQFDQPQLRVCEDTPALPQEWRNRARRVALDCSTVAKDRILVYVRQDENYAGEHWEYSFGC